MNNLIIETRQLTKVYGEQKSEKEIRLNELHLLFRQSLFLQWLMGKVLM